MQQPEPLFNFDYLCSLSNEPAFIASMIDLFLKHVPQQAEHLKQALQEQNATQAGLALHQIKPSLQAFGCSSLLPEVIELEQLLRNETPFQHLVQRLEDVHNQIKQLIAAIQQHSLKYP